MLDRLKLTPLSLVIAVCFTYAAYLILGLETETRGIGNGVKIAYTLVLVVILFLTDLLFRRFIESKKWIWLIQGSFILIIVVLMIIFQKR
ncbi:hypothetical protein [Pedobacter arcticus]|uniref:hypothetical protein n=1 Tax=Pedobacter arcticus TaxID=752140 RepID=UPI000363147E|nr:hypothetical protein [Pedobacter arcticus]